MYKVFWGSLIWLLATVVSAQVFSEQQLVRIGGESISVDEFVREVRSAVRSEFYHGAIPETELASYRRDVLDKMVDQVLFAGEALRQGVSLDAGRVEDSLAKIESKKKDDPNWANLRQQLLPGMRKKVEREQLQQSLKQKVTAQVSSSVIQRQQYYEQHPDKFTRPMQQSVSLILLGVDPSAGQVAWDAEVERAKLLLVELKDGAVFEELAEIYSKDVTAASGGDMGLMHEGLLGEEAQQELDQLQAGELSNPVILLEGVAVFRLNQRIDAELLPFKKVEARLEGLLAQELAELEWQSLRFKLRSQTDIEYNSEFFERLGI
ncbi:MAG: peptidyl-prolyl cis-trans isomerase [Halopseudomonas sp.]